MDHRARCYIAPFFEFMKNNRKIAPFFAHFQHIIIIMKRKNYLVPEADTFDVAIEVSVCSPASSMSSKISNPFSNNVPAQEEEW